MYLPYKEGLPVNLLSGCFNNTVATYKFYWFLAILQSVGFGKAKISKKELFARMISTAWYTVNYFHISFGKQDLLQSSIEFVKQASSVGMDENQDYIFHFLANSKDITLTKKLWHFNKQVPHWFLSPWLPKMNRQQIYTASRNFSGNCLYALYEDDIVINEAWLNYLVENIKLLKDFCYWNLSIFLQARNPNVPDITGKIIKPGVRNNLAAQRKYFWDIVLGELGYVDCIYTGKKLTTGHYDIEHFIPYSFVSHDLVWNLIPADSSFNSAKSDKLPPLEKYYNPFYTLQKTALEIVNKKTPKNKFLEDYLTLFPGTGELINLPLYFTREKFRERIQPLITLASNNGFAFMH